MNPSLYVRMVRVAIVAGCVMAVNTAVHAAEESTRALPTLLIKGEVVSVDQNDPTATLLKVKDRYGFETPIYLTQETKIGQADQAMTIAGLAAGMNVEVEYNFDINTAKRHAVSVVPSAAAAAPATPPALTSSTPVPAPVVTTPASSVVSPEPAMPVAPAPATEPAEVPSSSLETTEQPAPSAP